MEQIIFNLNNSKFFTGCAMMCMNIGSRYITMDLPHSLDNLFKHIWLRRLVIFCIAFVATHDIKISLLITLIYILLFSLLLNEKSKVCILPNKYLDLNKDGMISKEEIDRAKKILSDYQKLINKQ